MQTTNIDVISCLPIHCYWYLPLTPFASLDEKEILDIQEAPLLDLLPMKRVDRSLSLVVCPVIHKIS